MNNLNHLSKYLAQLQNLSPKKIKAELASRSLLDFVLYTKPDYEANWHHELICNYLNRFIKGEIKKLMIFVPPQRGKSELASRRLPAYLLGVNPDLKIAGCSYSGDFAKSFNRDIQRIIEDPLYRDVFPETTLNAANVKTAAKGNYLRNAMEFEVIGNKGRYTAVGVGGALTGKTVDIGIIDDPIKNMIEAESPTYRARIWDWYTSVFFTRLHKNSQQLIIQTRWNEDDLSGRILKYMNKDNSWVIVTLPAIKEGFTMEEDKREVGETLWPKRHSKESVLLIKAADERTFHALYQQDPKPFKGGLVYSSWNLISEEGYENISAAPMYGLDWGFTNPLGLLEVKIIGKDIYFKELLYETKLRDSDTVSRLISLGISRTATIIADSAQPSSIKTVFTAGFNIHPVSKVKNGISWGCKKLQEYNIHIVRSSVNLQEEIKVYRYKQNMQGEYIEEPISEKDHLMDCARYVVMSLHKKGFVDMTSLNNKSDNNLPIFF